MKQALLCVSFGTATKEGNMDLVAVESALRSVVPDRHFACALTSKVIRKQLAAQGKTVDSLSQALSRLEEQGFRMVAVQPTYLLYGIEYDTMKAEMELWIDRFDRIATGRPLLADSADEKKIARILADVYPPRQKEALLLVGHGSDRLAGRIYSTLQSEFASQGRPDVFSAALKGGPGVEQILPVLREHGYHRVHLVPLLLTAGIHACREMAGQDQESWKSRLEAAGFAVRCTLQGLGRLPDIQQMYCDKCKEILELTANH